MRVKLITDGNPENVAILDSETLPIAGQEIRFTKTLDDGSKRVMVLRVVSAHYEVDGDMQALFDRPSLDFAVVNVTKIEDSITPPVKD